MEKKLRAGIILLKVAIFIFLGYLGFTSFALSFALWQANPVPILFAFIVGPFIFFPLIVMFSMSIIRIQKVKQFSKMKLSLFILGIIMAPLSVFVGVRLIDRQIYKVTYTFTPLKWQQSDENERGRLIDSFREQYDLIGEPITFAVSLLGEPDRKEEGAHLYHLGDYRMWIALDPHYYYVAFDENEIIHSEYIFQG